MVRGATELTVLKGYVVIYGRESGKRKVVKELWFCVELWKFTVNGVNDVLITKQKNINN